VTKRVLQISVGSVAVFLLLLGTAGTASAHAQLESTDPAASSVLLVAPTQVALHFGEPVEIDFGSLRVLGPGGERVDSGGTHHLDGDSHAVAVSLPSNLAHGAYVVAWRVTSADSHPVHGAFVFSIGSDHGAGRAATVASALADQTGSAAVGFLYWVIRFAAFSGLLVLVGLALMVTFAWRPGAVTPRVGRILWGSWWLLLVATVLGIAIQGVYAAALPFRDILRRSLLEEVLHTRFGQIEVLRLVLLVAFAPVLLGLRERLDRGPRRWRWVLPAELVLGPALLATAALAGHAATGGGPGVGIALDLVHLAAASVWLGGLALLATFLVGRPDEGGRPEEAVGVTLTVSAVALSSVVLIVVTGTFQSLRQVGSVYALFHTSYGRTLVVKIALVVLLVGLGARSRRILHRTWGLRGADRVAPVATAPSGTTSVEPHRRVAVQTVGTTTGVGAGDWPGAGAGGGAGAGAVAGAGGGPGAGAVAGLLRSPGPGVGQPGHLRILRRTVLVELTIALAVLAVTAFLVNEVPAKQAAGLPFSTSFTTLGVQVNAIVDPARAGSGNEIHVYVLSSLGTPKAIPELDATLSLPSENLGPLTIPLRIGGPGHYYAIHVDIPVTGTWILRITVRTDAIDEQVVSMPFPVH
jgi:copper transport protein